ncbi:MAG: AmmeMemoRadiSam system protein B [Chloroflexi bacterium]|nr:AmmeMemoRadiSam system protein B [Chloroflexota bacterium]
MAEAFPLADRPRLRPVEIFPVNDAGQRMLVLRDPSDPSIRPIVVSDGAAQVLMLLDGQRNLPELTTALTLRGSMIGPTQLRSFLERLDQAGFLEGARAEKYGSERVARFRAAPVRQAVHAAGAYPAGATELARMLAKGYLDAVGPGELPRPRQPGTPTPRAIIAPHVDLHRGAPTYSWAYKEVAEAEPAELYVVLGTCHTPVKGHFAATKKPYDTPLGAVPSDAAFLDRLGRACGFDLFEGEFSHAGEHSIEFQAVYLRSLGVAGEGAAPMAPILCDSLHGMVPPRGTPREVPLVARFVDALLETLASERRRVTLVAAVDLAHVGTRFGDAWRVDAAHMQDINVADHELLRLALQPDADAYYAHVMRDDDARRICGFTPIYVLTALMQAQQRRGDLLRYTQWVDTDGSSSVTFASAIYR